MNRGLIVVLFITLLAYLNILGNVHVWDDGYFLGWQGYQDPINWAELLSGKIPMAYGQVYRPLRSVWYVLSIKLWGSWLPGYHLQSILVHLMITALVFYLTKEINIKHKINKSIPFITALLFGLHPIHTEAVTWMTASFDTIGIGFMFGSIYCYLKNKSKTSVLLAGLAFFTYELTLTLPLVMMLFNRNKSTKPYWLLALGYWLIRLQFITLNTLPYLFHSFWQNLLFIPVILFHYFKLMFIPYPLSVNHQIYPNLTNLYHIDNLTAKLNLLSFSYLIPTILLLVIIYYLWSKKSVYRFCLLWIVVTLLPILQLIPINSVFAERYTYIASFGVCFLIALIFNRLNPKLMLFPVVIFLFLTLYRNRVWQNTLVFWQTAEKTSPPSAFIFRQLGASYYIYKDYNQAILAYLKARDLNPVHQETYQKLYYLYQLTHQPDQAEKIYREYNLIKPESDFSL